MSNKNLPNYYVQSSINYVTNITVIYAASIAEWLPMRRRSRVRNLGQILHSIANGLSQLQHLR